MCPPNMANRTPTGTSIGAELLMLLTLLGYRYTGAEASESLTTQVRDAFPIAWRAATKRLAHPCLDILLPPRHKSLDRDGRVCAESFQTLTKHTATIFPARELFSSTFHYNVRIDSIGHHSNLFRRGQRASYDVGEYVKGQVLWISV